MPPQPPSMTCAMILFLNESRPECSHTRYKDAPFSEKVSHPQQKILYETLYTQTEYFNLHCACAPWVNELKHLTGKHNGVQFLNLVPSVYNTVCITDQQLHYIQVIHILQMRMEGNECS